MRKGSESKITKAKTLTAMAVEVSVATKNVEQRPDCSNNNNQSRPTSILCNNNQPPSSKNGDDSFTLAEVSCCMQGLPVKHRQKKKSKYMLGAGHSKVSTCSLNRTAAIDISVAVTDNYSEQSSLEQSEYLHKHAQDEEYKPGAVLHHRPVASNSSHLEFASKNAVKSAEILSEAIGWGEDQEEGKRWETKQKIKNMSCTIITQKTTTTLNLHGKKQCVQICHCGIISHIHTG